MGAATDTPLYATTQLSTALRSETQAIHTEAERSGVVRELLGGTITRAAYALYLRNLLPIYRALEDGLQQRRAEAMIGGFARRELFRASAIEADLAAMFGQDWARALPALPAAASYAARIGSASGEASGASLVAHAYVRYFGDLSGGQILRRILSRALALTDTALTFYDFPGIADIEALKAALRHSVDDAGKRLDDPWQVVREARLAFQANIDLSRAVQAHAAQQTRV